RSGLEDQILAEQESAAHEAADRVQEFMRSKIQNLIVHSQAPSVFRYIETGEGRDDAYLQLSVLLRQYRDVQDVSLLNRDGRETARMSLDHTFEDKELVSRRHEADFIFPFFRYGLEYIGPVVFSSEGKPMVNISVPITTLLSNRNDVGESGEIFGVLVARVSLEDILRSVSRFQVGSQGYVYIVDDQHRIVAHPDPLMAQGDFDASQVEVIQRHIEQQERLQQEGKRQTTTLVTDRGKSELGVDVLATHIYLPTLGFGVVMQQPIKKALAPIANVQSFALLLFIGGVSVAIIASVWLAGRLVSPVQQLHAGIEQVRQGNASYRAQINTKDEIQDLARAFNHMLDEVEVSKTELQESESILKIRVLARTRELQELTKSLDRKVKEKTKELESKVKELEKFNKLAVKRELKTIELKRELSQAKKKQDPSSSQEQSS
ncbi:MAG: cache domain-containing protein, partial [bacterium]|nr:cache domain-containing protein [bacterium]